MVRWSKSTKMNFNNYTPFPGIAWENVNANAAWFVTTVARVKFSFKAEMLVFDSDQGELFTSDQFFEEEASSVRYESDYVRFKKKTDIILNANAFSPDGKAVSAWECGIRIYDEKSHLLKAYGLRVKGEKKYLKAGPIWSPSFRSKATQVPIRYEKAYGGCIMIPAKDDHHEDEYIKVDPYNPIGCGIKKIGDPEQTVYSPQIEYLEKMNTKVPAGFGFINRAWKSRSDLAGTYDQAWVDNQHPLPPHDFNSDYNQGAHPELIMKGYLKGGSRIELTNLREGEPVQTFELPQLELLARLRTHTGDMYQTMNLDTLIIDVDDEDKAKHCVYASYRALTPQTQAIEAAEIMLIQDNEVTHG